jgi:UDP-glucose-4-epimerase GalE
VETNIKKVVVTGGCGYIGSHIAKALKLQGYYVIIVDNVRRDHTLKYSDNFVIADYASEDTYTMLLKEQPDAIVHCAGTSLVGPSVLNPAEYYHNNVEKTIQFLSFIRVLPKTPSIVFSSSAAVYGNPQFGLITEKNPFAPMSPYGQTKAIIEQILSDFNTAYNIPYVALRYFNACGADLDAELGQEPGATHIIARILEARINNTEFVLYGKDYNTKDGTCVRDYIHVVDLAEAHILAIKYLLNGGESIAMNLGTGSGISNRQIGLRY